MIHFWHRSPRCFFAALLFCVAPLAGALADEQAPAARRPGAKTNPIDIDANPMPVEIERVFPDLEVKRPLLLTFPPDGSDRVVVASQLGKVYITPNDSKGDKAEIFLDITKKVVYKDRENEEGFLGMAFHPKFKENGEFFVYYTTADGPPHTSVISRFKVHKDDPNKADPDSEEELLRIAQPFWNHNGGTIVFGPDGYLYIGMGDGGAANDPQGNGQKMGTLLGKILRIDVDHRDAGKNYASPKDNPFVDMPGARPEIWALGIRNVWRIAFDRETGKLWAGDVGQDTWEEIDIIERGGNYEWNLSEGLGEFVVPTPAGGRARRRAPGPAPDKIVGRRIPPIFEYHHDIGKSITGGNVYRGKKVPDLNGKYLFADYVSGQVYALEYDEKDGSAKRVLKIDGNTMPVLSFGEDEAGETYFMTDKGGIYRFKPSAN